MIFWNASLTQSWNYPSLQVVYLGQFPAIEAGDVLEAQVTMKQSEANPRQYSISVETLWWFVFFGFCLCFGIVYQASK